MVYIEYNPSVAEHRALNVKWRCGNVACRNEFRSSLSESNADWAWCPKCKSSASAVCEAVPTTRSDASLVAFGTIGDESFEIWSYVWRYRPKLGTRFDLMVDGAIRVLNSDLLYISASLGEMLRLHARDDEGAQRPSAKAS